jgi:hypothetical protein
MIYEKIIKIFNFYLFISPLAQSLLQLLIYIEKNIRKP